MTAERMSPAAARRTSLAAQGFAEPVLSGPVNRQHLRRTLDRIRLLQLDSVNVVARAHYLPVFSRLGAYSRELLDAAVWTSSVKEPRLCVEYWAHAASLLPVEDWPLFRWRMRRNAVRMDDEWKATYRAPGFVDALLTAVKELGPVGAGALERALGAEPRSRAGGWWNRSNVKVACEFLFATGELTTGGRAGFERLYDLTERVIPAHLLAEPELGESEAALALVERAARALGVATANDVRDYYRLRAGMCKPAVDALVESGRLLPVTVDGWAEPAYRHVDARTPRRIDRAALLCPFDPVVWDRARTERLFGFHYRVEIYVPEGKRQFGYYVFPFLLGDRLVA
ncbi:MAG: winged helix-turn-helix domain-containing protein, partial [Pseudonocardiaceae bacterium]